MYCVHSRVTAVWQMEDADADAGAGAEGVGRSLPANMEKEEGSA